MRTEGLTRNRTHRKGRGREVQARQRDRGRKRGRERANERTRQRIYRGRRNKGK